MRTLVKIWKFLARLIGNCVLLSMCASLVMFIVIYFMDKDDVKSDGSIS